MLRRHIPRIGRTPRYQTATFRPVRPPVLPGYGPGDHMPVTHASVDRRKRRAKRVLWRCATVVDVAVPLLDAVVVDEKELAMHRYLGLLASRV